MCPPTWAHWHHLVNTTELVLPLVHQSPQPKWQIDRFSGFCTAHGTLSQVHWRHLANTIEIVHINATWQIWLNLCLIRPSRVHNPNGKSIGPAVSAQLTAESPYTLQWAALSPKIAPYHGGSGAHVIHDSLGQSEPTIQMASWSVQLFPHRWPQSVQYFTMVHPFPLKTAHSYGGDLDPNIIYGSLGPTESSTQTAYR